MIAYVIRRVVAGVLLIVVMSFVTFALFFASPIDPADFACGKNCSVEQKEVTAAALGYDDNFVTQWVKFAKGVFVGRDYPDDPKVKETAPETVVHCPAPCLGYSTERTSTVTDLIQQTLPVTTSIAILAFVF